MTPNSRLCSVTAAMQDRSCLHRDASSESRNFHSTIVILPADASVKQINHRRALLYTRAPDSAAHMLYPNDMTRYGALTFPLFSILGWGKFENVLLSGCKLLVWDC